MSTDTPDPREVRTGDRVFHAPSGETWIVAYVEGDRLAWCGWPPGTAALSDCQLVEACSDYDHLDMLRRLAAMSGDDHRKYRAIQALDDIRKGR